jgi:hypothetical protein
VSSSFKRVSIRYNVTSEIEAVLPVECWGDMSDSVVLLIQLTEWSNNMRSDAIV